MVNYNNTKIYKLVCKDLSCKDFYVGSTATKWSSRRNNHKSKCHNRNSPEYNYKVYQVMREYGGWNNWLMIQIEAYPCFDIREKEARERYWVERLQSTLNMNKPGRDPYEMVVCDCGSIMLHTSKYNHKKSKKHKSYLESL